MFQRLHLLSTKKEGVAIVRGLGPSGPGQGRCSHPLTKELGPQKGPQTLGSPPTHQRHAKLENSVSRERHNKCYTRELAVWSGVGGGHKEED